MFQRLTISVLYCLAIATVSCAPARGQEEESAAPISVPGRQVLSGTISPRQANKIFVVKLNAGLYRVTYFSSTGAAIVRVSENGSVLGAAAPVRPQATIMHIVGGQLSKTIDLPPTGMCSSDLAKDDRCAGQKLHFQLSKSATISIEVSGVPRVPIPFRLVLDPLKFPLATDQLALKQVYTAYLAFDETPPSSDLKAVYHLALSRGQRVGIFFGSPDFGGSLEVRDSKGIEVAANAGFNEFLDPCTKVRIDRLPAFSPLSEATSYVTFESSEDSNYEITVRPRNTGETGLFIVRTFDLTDLGLEPERMRSGVLRNAPANFSLVLLPHWRELGSQVIVYSPLPVSLALKDVSGKVVLSSSTRIPPDIKTGLQPTQLSMLYSAIIDLGPLDEATISASHVEITGADTPSGQFFLVGFSAFWGSCGGGAVDPIAVVYPAKGDFKDIGFPLSGSNIPLTQFEAEIYSVARRTMDLYFLLQAPDGDQREPVELVSNYTHFEPKHLPISSYLVDYQIALRAQISSSLGTFRVWTRVERRGFKEKQWQLDIAESAHAQQQFVDALRAALGDHK